MSALAHVGIGIPGRWGRKGAPIITFNPGPHRYWRVRLYYFGGANAGLAEVEFRATVGGAAQTGGTAIASGSFSGSFLPANAFDANVGTFWAAPGAAGGEWVGMDYGAGQTRTVNQIALTSRNDVAQWPDVIVVDSSDDGAAWSVEWGINTTMFTAQGQQQVYTRPSQLPALHNQWRLRATSNNGAAQVAISILQLRSVIAQAWGECAGGTAISGGDFSPTYAAANAFSNTLADGWAAPGNTGWIGYQGGIPMAVQQIRLIAGSGANGFAGTQMPKDFVIESSDDGVEWTPEWSEANQTAWALNESRIFTRH